MIREMDAWRVGWARDDGDVMRAVQAPGHDRPRCVYVDFLATGPAVSKTLRGEVQRTPGDPPARRYSASPIWWSRTGGDRRGGLHIGSGRAADHRRQCHHHRHRRPDAAVSPQQRRAPTWAGTAMRWRYGRVAKLIDMEFVQFFPIGHLAPRLIGMDPIMWDPFRYKLGGRLLNGLGRGVRRTLRRDRCRPLCGDP